jgi:hypothetical protein
MTWLVEKGTFSCLWHQQVGPTTSVMEVAQKLVTSLRIVAGLWYMSKKVVGSWVLYQNNCSFVNFTLRLLNNFLAYMLVVVISLGSKLSFMQRGKIQSLFWLQAWFTDATSQTWYLGHNFDITLLWYWPCLAKLQLQKIMDFLELLLSSSRNSWIWSCRWIKGIWLSHFILILNLKQRSKTFYFGLQTQNPAWILELELCLV